MGRVDWAAGADRAAALNSRLTHLEFLLVFCVASPYRRNVGKSRNNVKRKVAAIADIHGATATVGVRIRQVRKERGMTLKQLASLMGCSHPTIHDWESGRRNPKLATIKRLAMALQTEPDWLLKGEGSIFIGPGPTPTSRASFEPPLVPVRYLPIWGEIPAGHPNELSENQPEPIDHLPVPDQRWIPKEAFALKARGDSMSPVIEDGDCLVVEINPYPTPGSIVIARTDAGESLVKKLRQTQKETWLESINPKYTQKYTRVVIWGRVVGIWRRVK